MKATLSKLYLVLIGAALSLILVHPAWSSDLAPYNEKTFEKAKTQGKIVLLQFHASWCPTCRNQKSALERVLKESTFSKVTSLSADYDDETELKKKYRVSAQSTLILFKGNAELGRSISVTDPEDLRTFLKKAF